MFSITHETDREIQLDGRIYTINDSFDNIINMYEFQERYKGYVGVLGSVKMLIGEIPDLEPEKICKLYEKLVKLYVNCGEKPKVEYDLQGNPIYREHKQLYSFKYDAWAIYSGFMQAYGIDLLKERGKMRWSVFKALLNGLPSETQFKKIIEIRQRPYPTGKGTSKERDELRKAKQELSFPGMDFSL